MFVLTIGSMLGSVPCPIQPIKNSECSTFHYKRIVKFISRQTIKNILNSWTASGRSKSLTIIEALELVDGDERVGPEHDQLVVQRVQHEHLRVHAHYLREAVVQLRVARVEPDLVVPVEDAVATCTINN